MILAVKRAFFKMYKVNLAPKGLKIARMQHQPVKQNKTMFPPVYMGFEMDPFTILSQIPLLCLLAHSSLSAFQ